MIGRKEGGSSNTAAIKRGLIGILKPPNPLKEPAEPPHSGGALRVPLFSHPLFSAENSSPQDYFCFAECYKSAIE